MIDPAGFALENFDAIGRWRTVDESFNPIDAAGQLPDGSKFAGVADLKKVDVAKGSLATLQDRLIKVQGDLTKVLSDAMVAAAKSQLPHAEVPFPLDYPSPYKERRVACGVARLSGAGAP